MVFRFVSLGLICLSWFRCGVFAFVAGLWLGFLLFWGLRLLALCLGFSGAAYADACLL